MNPAILAAWIVLAAQPEPSPDPVSPPAAWAGIPLIDLARESDRQVVVDREHGVYLGHVSTVLLPDRRTILAVYPKGHGQGAIVLKRSDDAGLTWSERLETPASWATSLECPSIHLLEPEREDPTLILFSGLHPARASRSTDLGRTWSELAPLGDWGGIVVMGSVFESAEGEHVAMFHDDGRFFQPPPPAGSGGRATGVFSLYATRSFDHGRSWSPPESILARSDLHLCEPGVVREPAPDGHGARRLAALLRENRRVANSHVIVSEDDAETWSDPRPMHDALTGDRHVVKPLPDGRLVATFRDMHPASPTRGDWVLWVGSFDDIIHARPGQYRARLMDNTNAWDCAYAGLEILPDTTIVATTYGHWTAGEQPYIVCVRATIAELDARSGGE